MGKRDRRKRWKKEMEERDGRKRWKKEMECPNAQIRI